jgi:hypothetical protein
MVKKYLILLAAIFIIASCGSPTPKQDDSSKIFKSDTHQTFLNNLASLCGKSFKGEQVYRSHHGDSWAEKLMIMHVTVCEDGKVHIPFHIDNDHSRTWMFVEEEGMLRFKHQHLHEDGTPEEGSMYGGYADENGTAFMQFFPADEFTGQVIEGGSGNVWIVSMDEELTWYSYRLDRDGEKRLEIKFDLTKPLEN